MGHGWAVQALLSMVGSPADDGTTHLWLQNQSKLKTLSKPSRFLMVLLSPAFFSSAKGGVVNYPIVYLKVTCYYCHPKFADDT